MLSLEDLKGCSEEQIVQHFIDEYSAPAEEARKYEVLIAYESVGSWGCDSSSWFLLKDKETGELYEQHGSHCSCYGFEDQWGPTKSSVAYLRSSHFYVSTGGYDDNADANQTAIKSYIEQL